MLARGLPRAKAMLSACLLIAWSLPALCAQPYPVPHASGQEEGSSHDTVSMRTAGRSSVAENSTYYKRSVCKDTLDCAYVGCKEMGRFGCHSSYGCYYLPFSSPSDTLDKCAKTICFKTEREIAITCHPSKQPDQPEGSRHVSASFAQVFENRSHWMMTHRLIHALHGCAPFASNNLHSAARGSRPRVSNWWFARGFVFPNFFGYCATHVRWSTAH
jgi:hypothetical protein